MVGVAECATAEVVEQHDVVEVGQVAGGPQLDERAEKILGQDRRLFRIARGRIFQRL